MKAVKAEQRIMSDSITAAQAGPCVFKMPESSQHKSSKQAWYSPPFYSHPGGYKMCIRVDASGYGDAAGTHVSVFAFFIKGRNDDNLPWPFTGEVTITLFNQLENENHYRHSVSFPPDDRQVVGDGRAYTGYGQYKFIPQYQLARDPDQNCQYLKNDCLYFEIKVHVTKAMKLWLTCTV